MQFVACRMEGVRLREANDSVLDDTACIANRSLEHLILMVSVLFLRRTLRQKWDSVVSDFVVSDSNQNF